MRQLLFLPLLVVFVAITAAQPSPQRASDATLTGVQETDHLTLKPSTTGAGAPGRVSLLLEIAPKPKMHVYAPGQKQYIPVSLTLARDEAVKAHAPVFPPGEKYFFKPLNETQLVYSKPFRIVQDVTIAASPALRDRPTLTINGTVRYQACDDEICYIPKTVPVAWTVAVKKR